MAFALLDDFVNLKDLHIKQEGKNPCHSDTRQQAYTVERNVQLASHQHVDNILK
jgi:hypothetical protein